MADKRLRYYNGQFLQEQDFRDEQEYHLDRQRRHNRQLHAYGIAEGLTVTADLGATSATVSSGTAIDSEGRTIVLTESRTVQFGSLTGPVLVVISYDEQESDPATAGDEGDTRFWERPDVKVIAETGAPEAHVSIRLAKLLIAANGTISQQDLSVRTSAGKLGVGSLKVQNALSGSPQFVQDQNGNQSPLAIGTGANVGIGTNTPGFLLTVAGKISKAPSAEVFSEGDEASIRYTNNGGVPWHVGSGGNAGPGSFFFWNGQKHIVATITPEGTLTANGLSVKGDVLATGTVDGRDVSADGARLDALASSTIEGVSLGGNIDLVGQAGISVTGDDAAKKITIANAAGSLNVQNRLGSSPQFVQDQNGNQSPLAIGTGANVGIGTNTPGFLLTVAGKISKAPSAEVFSEGDEASIRYTNNDGVPWHVGSGGNAGPGSFFFWNGQKRIVATITPEGTLTANGLSVKGDVLVTGTVDGRDVSADGARLDALASSTIDGVSNPGGNIDLVGEAGITVTGNNSSKRITIANADGNLKVQDPLSDSLQFVKDQNGHQSPVMISTTNVEVNTESEQAAIFKVVGNISSAPLMEVRSQKNEASIRYLSLDSADKVAWHVGTGGAGGSKNFFFWNDSAGPNGKVVATITPAGSLTLNGNLTVNGGLSMRRTIVTASFAQTDHNDKIKPVEVDFQPKFISMEGRAHVWFGEQGAYASYGGAIGGFCHVSDSGEVVRASGHGPHIYRFPGPPYIGFYNELHGVSTITNAICNMSFHDHAMDPKHHVYLEIFIESITSTGFSLRLFRRSGAGFTPPDVFSLEMAFAVLG